MILRNFRSIGLLIVLTTAAAAPFLVNCAAPSDEDADDSAGSSEDAVTGIDNPMGLRLTYDSQSGHVNATLKSSLKAGEQLRIRVRRGTATLTSQKELKCSDLSIAKPIVGEGNRELAALGKVIYAGPAVDQSMIDLMHVYHDARWQSDPVWARSQISQINSAGGPTVLVEACITQGTAVRAKLQTGLEYAWDQGVKDADQIKQQSFGGGTHFMSGDAGAPEPADHRIESMEEYAEKCVEDLGEIPFFKKLADGKYDTFDCRDTMGTGEGHDPTPIEGVEGARIPLQQDGNEVLKCDGEGPNGTKSWSSYDCVDKCDHAEFLSEGCEVGPTVTHAENSQGSHWVLLCRKVANGQDVGWTKTKKFDDIAMIGTNPKTGKTCFFQNKIGSGTDGEHVPHPGDKEKSRTLWDGPEGYCFESCHGTDPFIQSPWINGAKRRDGKPIVPMMGYDPDFQISRNDSPYYIVNMDAQGWNIPQQLVNDDSAPCQSCHRVGGDAWMREFANWTAGNNTNGGAISDSDTYWGKITDSGRSFAKSHFMPMRLDGITADTWEGSKWQKAIDSINKCRSNSSDPSCAWADVPRGAGNPPKPADR